MRLNPWATIRELREQVSDWSERNLSLREALEQAITQHDDASERHAEVCKASRRRIEELEAEIRHAKEQHEASLGRHSTDLRALNRQLISARERNEALADAVRVLQDERARILDVLSGGQEASGGTSRSARRAAERLNGIPYGADGKA
jgi:chromosome segregation ATPase